MSKEISTLLEKLKNQKRSQKDIDFISRAFEFAEKAHLNQKRLNGGNFIEHPAKVALVLAELNLDKQTIAAGLLHDTLEDNGNIDKNKLAQEFNKNLAFLVEGASKLKKLQYGEITGQAENLRKLFLATAQDIRVMLIKLADRLDNLSTLNALPKAKQKRKALETLEVYAPIAYRLGMGEMKGQLEDLAFPYVYPQEFKWLMKQVKEKYEERKQYLKKITPVVQELLKEEGIDVIDIHARAKHYYSLWQKLKRYEMDLERIYDLVALRIIVPNIESCYETLGAIHRCWKPLPGRIKDYIALPKLNGYRSLHTTVFCEKGKITEFQIRTPQMHEEAEFGIAAHWSYKEHIDLSRTKKYLWIQQLRDWQKKTGSPKELLESLRIDFFKNRIFVFTPKGTVIDLPENATPIDFAYQVHTDIGNTCYQALVNGKIVALDTSLQNGDLVEILTHKEKKPARDWLKSVKTSFAKSQIRKFLKKASREENFKQGLYLLNNTLKELGESSWANQDKQIQKKIIEHFNYKYPEDLLSAIGRGEITAFSVVKIIIPEKQFDIKTQERKKKTKKDSSIPIIIAGEKNLLFSLAKCCNPLPGESIKAFLSKSQGTRIHRTSCLDLEKIAKINNERILPAIWEKIKNPPPLPAGLVIKASDRIGLIQDISSTISNLGINIIDFQSLGKGIEVNFKVIIETPGIEDLYYLISRLKEIEGILEVKRG